MAALATKFDEIDDQNIAPGADPTRQLDDIDLPLSPCPRANRGQ